MLIRTCVSSGTFPCTFSSANRSGTLSATAVVFWTDLRDASSLWEWEQQSNHQTSTQLHRFLTETKANQKAVPGSIAAAIVHWASLTLFITLSSSLAAACGVSSGGFTIALLEWFTLKEIKQQLCSDLTTEWHLSREDVLQRSVSEHDSIEGQSSSDRILLDKLYESEARWLSLVSGHPHKLYIPHLPEELQQLVCSGGLWNKATVEPCMSLSSHESSKLVLVLVIGTWKQPTTNYSHILGVEFLQFGFWFVFILNLCDRLFTRLSTMDRPTPSW